MFNLLKNVLTSREKEVLEAIADGKASKQIADELQISKQTVDTHRRNMIEKAGANNTTELIKKANKEGLIK
jgi:DNA-binding NarL/FixJ family response regulator